MIAIPIDETDDNNKLAAFRNQWNPPARLVNLHPSIRKDAAGEFAKALDGQAPVPSTVVTDSSGRIIAAQAGVPSVVEVRKMFSLSSPK